MASGNCFWEPASERLIYCIIDLGNRVHPADGKSLFCRDDPRLEFTVSDVDPRIHFALVCGAKVFIILVVLS